MKQLLTIITTLLTLISFSQAPTFDWAKKWGNWASTCGNCHIGIYAFDMAVDSIGNSYVLSYGNTQVDFGLGSTQQWGPTAGCGAISKIDPNGNLIWVKFITKTGGTGGGVEPKAIYYKNGFLYYTGTFGGGGGIYDFDFSPTATTNTLTGSNVFVSKIDLDGNFLWLNTFGFGTTIQDIHVSNDLSVYLTGSFNNNFSFGSTNAIFSGGTNGTDIYIAKMNNAGSAQWLKYYGSNGNFGESGYSLSSDSNSNLLIGGRFSSTVNFNPTGPGNLLTASGMMDFFLQKINASGTVIWTINSNSSSNNETLNSITVDSNNDILLTGVTYGQMDFDFSSSSTYLVNANTPAGNSFIAKIDQNTNLSWVKLTSNNSTNSFSIPKAIVVDQNNNVYTTGLFSGSIDFYQNTPQSLLNSLYSSSNGYSSNTYFLKLTPLGNFVTCGSFVNTTPNYQVNQVVEPYSIYANDTSIIITGSSLAPADFDPGIGTYLLNSNTTSAPNPFICKLAQCPGSYSNQTVNSCGPYISVSNQLYSISGIYTDTIQNAAGCDSIITINLTILNPSTSTLDTISCTSYTAPSGTVHTTSGIFSDTIPNAAGCDSIITINLTITQPTTSSIAPNLCSNSYTAPDGQVYSQSGTYTAIIPNAAGCDSTIIINLTLTPVPNVNAGADQVICEGSSVTLSGTGATVYNWSDGIINAVAFQPPVGTHNYIVTGTSANGCTDIDTITVFVTPLPVVSFTGENTVSCSPVTFSLTNTTPNALNCTWDISNGDDIIGCGSVIGTISQVGCHDVTLTTTDNNGCSNSFTAPNFICVEATPNATFTASPSSFSQPNEQIVFTNNSSGANTYFWDFGDSSPSSNLLDPTHVYEVGVQDSFVVELIAYSTFACTDTSYLTIYYAKSSDTDVFIPTGFSPNNDGENDSWTISGLENYPNATINVFNRWGQLLFEGGPSNPTWNGMYLGELLPTADYYYIIDLGEGSKYNGVVTLKQ